MKVEISILHIIAKDHRDICDLFCMVKTAR